MTLQRQCIITRLSHTIRQHRGKPEISSQVYFVGETFFGLYGSSHSGLDIVCTIKTHVLEAYTPVGAAIACKRRSLMGYPEFIWSPALRRESWSPGTCSLQSEMRLTLEPL